MIKKLMPLFLLASFLFPVAAPETEAGGLPPILSPATEESKETAEEKDAAEEMKLHEPEEATPREEYEIDAEEFLVPELILEEEPRESSGAWIPIAFLGAFAAALIVLRALKRGA